MEYKDFRIGDLFEVRKGKRLTQADMIPGPIKFVGATSENNGETARIGNTKYLHAANTITVTYNGSVGEVFYQDEPFWASDDVNVLYPQWGMTVHQALYIMTAIRRLRAKYSYTHKWVKELLENDRIFLPATSLGEPDYVYMEKYISELEREHISGLERERSTELERYLEVAGLEDYKLTEEDRQILQLRVNYGEFRACDFFETEIKITNKRSKMDITKSGTIPLMSSESTNNGIIGYVQIKPEFIVSKENPFYLVFGDHTKAMNIMTTSFCVADNVKVLRPYGALSERSTLYIAAAWKKAIPDKGYARHWAEAKNVYFRIPVACDGKPDYVYMEKYVRVQEKLAIKNMVALKDRVIQEARKIVRLAEK